MDEDCRRLDRQGWAVELGQPPYVRLRRGAVLNQRPDGSCVFLDENNRCRIHAKYGEDAKPLACRIFPFSLRSVARDWQASLRFDCPSAALSKGRPLGQHRAWLSDLAGELRRGAPAGADVVHLQRGVVATPEELNALLRRLVRWLQHGDAAITARLVGAARVTEILAGATLKKVRSRRFDELLDLLFGALAVEGGRATKPCSTPPSGCDRDDLQPATAKQHGMLRQLAFAHAEHVTLSEMRAGVFARIKKRRGQLRAANQFLRGVGAVPELRGFSGQATFEAVEAVTRSESDAEAITELLGRYTCVRLVSRSVFGNAYYGWNVFTGLAALWLSVAAAGWLARYEAASNGRTSLTVKDLIHAIGIVDRAATRAPSLGTFAERARVSYLLRDDGIARLLVAYAPL